MVLWFESHLIQLKQTESMKHQQTSSGYRLMWLCAICEEYGAILHLSDNHVKLLSSVVTPPNVDSIYLLCN